jgi:hypothetical protein
MTSAASRDKRDARYANNHVFNNSIALVPELPPLVGEVSGNFCG